MKESNRNYYLYTLNDPTTNEIRYVGITCNMKKRLKYHIADKANTKKTRWIKSLIDNKLVPTINELKTTNNVREVIQWEIDTIAEYSKIYNLTNSTSGGEYYGIGTPVEVYTLDGVFIDAFISMIEAAEFFGLSENAVGGISACCVGKRNYAYDHIWRYVGKPVTKDDLNKVKLSLEAKRPKEFFLISLDGTKKQKVNDIHEAAAILNVVEHWIYDALKRQNGDCINGYLLCLSEDDFISQKELYKSRHPKEVEQYTLDGEYITTYKNMSEAARSVNKPNNVNLIRSCCLKQYAQAMGYIWRFVGDTSEIIPALDRNTFNSKKHSKTVYMKDETGKIIAIYDSAKIASEQTGYNATLIRKASANNAKYKDYYWTYNCPY